ncbi:hypothetical protein GCM10009854_41980 [Saccharopolyspora halophila]|uniref:Uncharacterized protein n=1 Tax=Saccharopolyspora halophila TaxID=405551 RepID=A0ABN3GRT0_9PSEU
MRLPLGHKHVEVPADRGGADPELFGHRSSGDRPPFQQQPRNRVTGPAVALRSRTGLTRRVTLGSGCGRLGRPDLFHNMNVTYFAATHQHAGRTT